MSELEFNKIVANNIRYYLDRSELTQKEFAKLLGVGQTSVYNWLNAIKIPRSDKIDAMCNIFSCKRADILLEKPGPAAAPSQDPLRDYYDRLIRYLDSSPEHWQLISDAAHVRAEDIDLARQFLARLADPDSSAPELPTLGTSANFQALPSSNHGQAADPQEAPEKILRNAKKSCDCADTHVELTDEALALVRDTPEVLAAEAEYIKKMSVKPRRKGATASPSTDAEGRKSG